MTLRSKRRLLALALHVTIMAILYAGMILSATSGRENLFVFSGVAFFGYALTLRVNPLPGLLQCSIIRQTDCPDCGQVIDLVGVWRCGCGFRTWRPRHAFSPCRSCGKIFRWVVCPNCVDGEYEPIPFSTLPQFLCAFHYRTLFATGLRNLDSVR